MDKNDKYYNLIESIVKQHKKYHGLEHLLDDIIDDVYAHSSIILNTINNEDVITSYLQKIVGTSLITVSKKANLNTYKSCNAADFINQINKNIQAVTSQEQASNTNNYVTEQAVNIEPKANKELVDKMINSIGEVSLDNNAETPNEEFMSEQELEDLCSDENDNILEIDNSEYDDLSAELSNTDESLEYEESSIDEEDKNAEFSPETNSSYEFERLDENDSDNDNDNDNDSTLSLSESDLSTDEQSEIDSIGNIEDVVTEDVSLSTDENEIENLELADETEDEIVENLEEDSEEDLSEESSASSEEPEIQELESENVQLEEDKDSGSIQNTAEILEYEELSYDENSFEEDLSNTEESLLELESDDNSEDLSASDNISPVLNIEDTQEQFLEEVIAENPEDNHLNSEEKKDLENELIIEESLNEGSLQEENIENSFDSIEEPNDELETESVEENESNDEENTQYNELTLDLEEDNDSSGEQIKEYDKDALRELELSLPEEIGFKAVDDYSDDLSVSEFELQNQDTELLEPENNTESLSENSDDSENLIKNEVELEELDSEELEFESTMFNDNNVAQADNLELEEPDSNEADKLNLQQDVLDILDTQPDTESENRLLYTENNDDQEVLFGSESDLSNNTDNYYGSILPESQNDIESDTVYEQIDYESLRNYDQNENNSDAELIKQKLNSLIAAKPELNIADIYKLRFEQKKTISDIAKELNMERKDIISAIDEIVDLV